ncbi:MAG: hypothetical protein WBG82_05330 [Parvibaculum sp.]|uniref:sensor histidine kinase n=1 Tax=Parvibaculum sp. TaxID=2024848 RepID=UPI003C7792EC
MAAPIPKARRAAVLALLGIIVIVAALPQFVQLPVPRHSYSFDTAEFSQTGKSPQVVSLPSRWVHESASGPGAALYRLTFTLGDLPDAPLALFIPVVRQTIEVRLNGHLLPVMPHSSWSSSRSGYAYAASLPRQFIKAAASNDLEIRMMRTDGWLSGYLSRIYISTSKDIRGYQRIADLLIEQWRAMTFALHAVTVMGFITILLFRRHDPVFQWLTLITGWSLVIVLSQSPILGQLLGDSRLYLLPGVAAVGLMAMGVALALTGRSAPSWLRLSIWLVPLNLFLLGLTGLVGLPVAIVAGSAVTIVTYGIAAAILIRDFAMRGGWQGAFLSVPFALSAWFGAHDVLMGLGLNDGVFMLMPYMRTMILVAITILLMGRLAESLNKVDVANDVLLLRLAEQEKELNELHERDRQRTEQSVLECERQRLMSDLHDGLSGHLVSIIALAERNEVNAPFISASAREALDDLRLVIQSLDIGDSDLLVALAGWRERLEPRLRRLGVKLEWSMEAIPQITGVTPGNALSVLRILQEAVTNALKHGPATRISIRGMPRDNGAAIIIENDLAESAAAGKGHGVANMQRRAEKFGALVRLDLGERHARLELRLPFRLSS